VGRRALAWLLLPPLVVVGHVLTGSGFLGQQFR
jgi:hypothetical protein